MKKDELTGAAKRIESGLQYRLSSKAAIGEKKHISKQEVRRKYLELHGNLKGFNPAKVPGIHSISTIETYRRTMIPLAVFAAEHGIKNASQITPELAGLFLQIRDAYLSAWTISREMAAINKALDFCLNKKDLGLKSRLQEDIKNNRKERPLPKKTKYADHIIIFKASGMRRESITAITANDCIRNASGLVIGIHVKEKNGRERIAPILNMYKETVTEIVDRRANGNEPLFDKFGRHIHPHQLRAAYCMTLLEQLTNEYNDEKPLFGGDLSPASYVYLRGKDRNVGDTYRNYPTFVVAAVSGAMGHNRLSIVFSNYSYAAPMTSF